MERFTVSLERFQRTFAFTLCTRPLVLGPAGEVDYYWIDSAALRRRPPGPNFRACVDFWWAAMEDNGADSELDTQISSVLAECYPLVNSSRSLQDVYLDAHLVPKDVKPHATAHRDDGSVHFTEHDFSLPADETARLREVGLARDSALVRAELEDLFLGPMPPDEEMPAYQEAAQAWIGNGIVALRKGDTEALTAYVPTVEWWITTLRKQGGDDRVRRFLNMFAYECKVAFYRCVANAWSALIPWLREHRGPDTLGERLLQLWHHQNQPGEDDTASPGGNRDVFAGQILSLHPLSAFVMNDLVHLQALGAWIAHPNHDELVQNGRKRPA